MAINLGNAQLSKLRLGTKEVLKGYVGNNLIYTNNPIVYDIDAQTYFTAVEAADGSLLETPYKNAVNTLVVNLKDNALWNSINKLYLFSTAKTLAGLAVPLKGTAPTAFLNYQISDYNRKTGLKGNTTSGSERYINIGHNDNALPQNDFHIALWDSDNVFGSTGIICGGGNTRIINGSNTCFMANRTVNTSIGLISSHPFRGSSRASSTEFIARMNSTNVTRTVTSIAAFAGRPYFIHAFNSNASNVPTNFSTSRISIFSLGNAIDLAALQTYFNTYMNTLSAL